MATEPPAAAGAATGAAAGSTAETARQDAALRQALQDAAARIRDFQQQAEHQARAVALDEALVPERAKHEAERERWAMQLAETQDEAEALRRRVAELEGARAAAIADGAAWQERATTACAALETAERQHAAAESELQQQLAEAREGKAALASSLQQAEAAAAAEAASFQERLSAERARAEQLAMELEAAKASWQGDIAAMEGCQQQQSEAWARQLEALHLQVSGAEQRAAMQESRADDAEQEAASLRLKLEQVACELGEARQEGARLEAAIAAAKEQGADLGARLQAAEQQAQLAGRRAEEAEQQLAAMNTRLQEQAVSLQAEAEERRYEGAVALLQAKRSGSSAAATPQEHLT